MRKKAERLKLSGWSKSVNDNNETLVFWDEICAIPKLSVTIEASLAVYKWLLPDEHTFYLTHNRSVRHATLSSILSSLQQFQLCDGISAEDLFISVAVDPSSDHYFGNIIRHTVPMNQQQYDANGLHFRQEYFYSHMIATSSVIVIRLTIVTIKKNPCKRKIHAKAAKEALSATSKDRLVATIQEEHVVCKQLEEKITALVAQIEKNSIVVN